MNRQKAYQSYMKLLKTRFLQPWKFVRTWIFHLAAYFESEL